MRLCYGQAVGAAERFHDAGYTVVLQDVMVGPLLGVVVLLADVGIVMAREAGRAKTAYGPGKHSLVALDFALRHETPRLGLWLDTSTLTSDDPSPTFAIEPRRRSSN